ncbi:hypothetical protein FB45DRAFT_1011289 [Roridomyces roridus]|uniref:Uncharacterized protein n=1 Tax=Roridomyces roridus TaxID=1738132 RepID=A0AAD7B200_9AGAR|nr:hypothetical protein FB45DRAFT_1011289 [Roridomyces roridus]
MDIDDTTLPPPLSEFKRTESFEPARKLLWPDVPPSEITEPARLTQIIDTCTPDDSWLTSAVGDILNHPEDFGNTVRYIHVGHHEALRSVIRHLAEKGIFIIRQEYRECMEHALLMSTTKERFQFFFTGQSGIGITMGARYFLLYLLALGKPVFWVKDNWVYYFDRHGVQSLSQVSWMDGYQDVNDALRAAWVIIDTYLPNSRPNEIFSLCPFVIWAASPVESDWWYFCKRFSPDQQWFMKPWSTKEIAAYTELAEVPRSRVLTKMEWCGPVPRWLFRDNGFRDARDVESRIVHTLSGKHFGDEINSENVFLIRPAVVHDDATGSLILQRDLYTTEFLTPAVAELTIQRATRWMNHGQHLRQSVSSAFRASYTHDLAGKLVEGVIHCALSDGVALPEALDGGVLAATIEFRGTVDNFVLIDNSKVPEPAATRPLYLRPAGVASLPAIDAIFLTSPTQLVLFHTSLSETLHNWDFGTMLRIVARLPKLGAGIGLESIEDVVCCVVGIPEDSYRVKNLVRQARRSLIKLQGLGLVGKGVPMDTSSERLRKFRVIGFLFEPAEGFVEVEV